MLADDTYVVSFPRSGNTYLRHLLTALILDSQPSAEDVHRVVPDIHRIKPPVRPSPGPLVVKSHAPPREIPAKVVYLVRDGRAALLSYHRYRQLRGWPGATSPDQMLEPDDVWPCPWEQHASGWLDRLQGGGRGIVVRYEDLVADPATSLGRIAELVGIPCADDGIARAVERSSFEMMRAAEWAGRPGSLNFVGTAQPPWPDVFSPPALAAFEKRARGVLTALGYPVGPVSIA